MTDEVIKNGIEGSLSHDADAAAKKRRKAIIVQKIVSAIPLMACVILGLLYIISAALNGYNLAIGLEVVIANATIVALVATGATFIFTSGSFDLSLGSNMLISAIIGGLAGKATNNIFVMIIVCIAVAVSLSVLNSVLASFFNLPVFIMTIVMMNVYGSVATLMITAFGTNAAISVPMSLVSSLNNTGFRIILLVSFELFCCFIFYILKTGRKQKFLGGNPVCASLSGIRSKKLTILSFALAGIGIGLASFAMIVETPTLSSSSGSSVGMNMLIALVFGGMNMSGGPRSKMYAALLGSFSMAFLDSFMNIYVTGSWYLQIVKGVLFVVVVFLFSIGNRAKLLER
ncbi:MAG: hypothetical protein ACI4QR_06540 [Eubacteriales bacterium]